MCGGVVGRLSDLNPRAEPAGAAVADAVVTVFLFVFSNVINDAVFCFDFSGTLRWKAWKSAPLNAAVGVASGSAFRTATLRRLHFPEATAFGWRRVVVGGDTGKVAEEGKKGRSGKRRNVGVGSGSLHDVFNVFEKVLTWYHETQRLHVRLPRRVRFCCIDT